MKKLSKILIASSLLVALASCNDEFEHPVDKIEVTSGTADFTRYVALGNSLTAGYMNNALYKSGQEYSYANILAHKMLEAGAADFKTPFMPDDIGGFSNLGVSGKMILAIDPETGAMGPVTLDAVSPFTPASGGPFGNMGIPGAKSYHLVVPGYGNPAGIPTGTANPYFARFASSPTTSVLADAAAQNPTFFTLWIGNNDVLYYATSGGIGVNQLGNIDASTYGTNDISDPSVVAGSIQIILEKLRNEKGARGAIANIPSVTDIPFFTTVPTQPFTVNNLGADNINALATLYAPLNAALDMIGASDRKITFSTETANGAVIIDEDLSNLSTQLTGALVQLGLDQTTAFLLGNTFGQARQTNEGDLILFTAQTVLGNLNMERMQQLMQAGVPQEMAAQLSLDGVTNPLEDQWVLIPSEINAITTATNAYNATIAQLAEQYDMAFIDANAAMKQLSSESGIVYFGNTYTTTYVSGGAFSLDGIHLSAKGYAIVANFFIDAINTKYGSTLRNVNPNNYPGVIIP